jgi:pimeloyl-ACP methyl ester carboxylesterase
MRSFGHERFFVAGHDRGARVAHRLSVDHPESVYKVCLLDIAPTLTMYRTTNQEFRAYDRPRSGVLPAAPPGSSVPDSRSRHTRSPERVSPLLLLPKHHSRHLRRLPGRRRHRPRNG